MRAWALRKLRLTWDAFWYSLLVASAILIPAGVLANLLGLGDGSLSFFGLLAFLIVALRPPR